VIRGTRIFSEHAEIVRPGFDRRKKAPRDHVNNIGLDRADRNDRFRVSGKREGKQDITPTNDSNAIG